MDEATYQTLIRDSGYPDDSYHKFLEEFVTKNKCRRALEVGVGMGSSIVAIRRGMLASTIDDDCLIDGVDIYPIPEFIDSLMDCFYHCDSNDFLKEAISMVDYDMIHLDAHHSFDNMTNYLHCIINQDKMPKYVMIHDWISPTVQDAVYTFLNNHPGVYNLTSVDHVYNGACYLTRLSKAKATEPRHITVQLPAGIGDITWVMQKLCNANVTVDLEISGEGPKRGKDYAELFKCVRGVKYNDTGYQDLHLNRHSDQINFEKGGLDPVYKLTANSHLELGGHINDYMPAYPTEFNLVDMINLPDTTSDLSDTNVVIYPSSYKSNKDWFCGSAADWFQFMCDIESKLNDRSTQDVNFILVGATWDRKMCSAIKKLCKGKLSVENTCGKLKIGDTLALVNQCDYMLAFPSGIGITSSMLGVKTLMFMPSHLKPMEYKWLPHNQKNLVHMQIADITSQGVAEALING